MRRLLPWVLLLVVALLAAALRLQLIEPPALAHQCTVAAAPAWCGLRQSLILGFLHHIYGYFAAAAAVLALLLPRRVLAWLAAALGAFALQMYCYELGAFALLVGCLRLARLQADAAPGQQHRQRQRQIQHQP